MNATFRRFVPVAVTFAAGALAERAVLARAPHALARDLAQPLPVATAWHAYGTLCFGVLAATVAAAALALGGAVLATLHGAAVPGRVGPALVTVAALALASALAWPVAFSSDVYAYAAYGALAGAGSDPYAPVGAGVHGALIDLARYQWGGPFPPCVYGPLFVALARGVVALTAPAGPAAVLRAFRLAAVLAFLGSVALLARALGAVEPRRRTLAVAAYALNPASLWAAAEGHNDALLLAAAAGAFVVTRGGRHRTGAAALGLTALLKAPGALFAAAIALDAALGRRPRRFDVAIAAAGGTLVAAALCLPPLVPALRAVGSHGRYAPQVSVQGLCGPGVAAGIALLCVATGSVRLARRHRDGFAWLAAAALAALPNGYPWYAPWLVPLALAAGGGPLAVGTYVATISATMRYLPDAAGELPQQTARVAAAVATLPLWLGIAVAAARTVRKKAVAPS